MANKKLIRNSTAEFLIFTAQDGKNSIEARYEDETIWLTQKLMGELFEVGTNTINYHLKELFKSNEIEGNRTIRKFRIVQTEGNRPFEELKKQSLINPHAQTLDRDSDFSYEIRKGRPPGDFVE